MKSGVVLDTNIFISAVLYGGNPRRILDLAVSERIEVYISLVLLDELRRVLKEKFSLSSFEVSMVIDEIKDFAEIIEPKVKLKVIKGDPSDNRVLECALQAKVDYIVSGDKHLLNLRNFGGIKIVNPAKFLKQTKLA